MSLETLLAVLVAGVAGHAVASVMVPLRMAAAPERLLRTNVSGRRVPAVLGEPLAAGALFALGGLAAVRALGWSDAPVGPASAATLVVILVMWGAGAWDDRQGDETSRGFAGHFAALRRGHLTGGILKIAAGVLAGGLAAYLVFPEDLGAAAATLLLVGLGANTINLFDRAPGRAGKVVLLAGTPLIAFGQGEWAAASAGAVGALLACLPFDLGERAMLGDAGANPLGASIGLGLAVSLDAGPRWIAVALLVVLNLASERWSFSAAIAGTPWLHRLDRMGRR